MISKLRYQCVTSFALAMSSLSYLQLVLVGCSLHTNVGVWSDSLHWSRLLYPYAATVKLCCCRQEHCNVQTIKVVHLNKIEKRAGKIMMIQATPTPHGAQ